MKRYNVQNWHHIDCGCGKRAHVDRASARRHVKKLRKERGEHYREYRCTKRPDLWHVGRIPQLVRLGVLSADDYYRQDTA